MHDVAGAAYLRRQTTTPIGANQSAWEMHHIPKVLAAEAADVIVTDPHQLGGLSLFRDVAGMCETARVPLVKHSFGDLGITTAATLHVLGGLGPRSPTRRTSRSWARIATPFQFQDGACRYPVPASAWSSIVTRSALRRHLRGR
jgi:glucarate dehydratase